MSVARENGLVFLMGRDRKSFIVCLEPGAELQTHRGVIRHDELIDQPLGREVQSHLGYPFLILEPSTHDLILDLKRTTQIMYPKDIGYVLLKMNIGPGSRVVEAGTGSGGLTLALARSVMPTGRVYSYEMRPDVLNLATKNLRKLGLLPFVDLKERDIGGGFDEVDADALFLDDFFQPGQPFFIISANPAIEHQAHPALEWIIADVGFEQPGNFCAGPGRRQKK